MPPYNRPEHGIVASMSFTEQDRREQIQYIVDLRRGVDLLLSLPEVDPQRLAYVGFSGGGAMGGLLAGVEHRLQGYVLVVGDGGIVTHITGPEDFGWWDYKPKDLREKVIAWMWPIEPIHYVGCAAPAALLFQNGTQDVSVPPADALRYQRAGSEPKTVLWYASSHDNLGIDALKDRAEWLRDKIGINSYHHLLFGAEVALSAWLVLTVISLAVIAYVIWRKNELPLGARLLWLPTVLVLGPVGLVIYWVSNHRSHDGYSMNAPTTPSRRALSFSSLGGKREYPGHVHCAGFPCEF